MFNSKLLFCKELMDEHDDKGEPVHVKVRLLGQGMIRTTRKGKPVEKKSVTIEMQMSEELYCQLPEFVLKMVGLEKKDLEKK
jgi:hypothetical protein